MAGPRLDLDEDQRRAILRHQVQLPDRGPHVPGNDLVAQATEVVLGEGLAASPEGTDWQKRRPPTRRAYGSR